LEFNGEIWCETNICYANVRFVENGIYYKLSLIRFIQGCMMPDQFEERLDRLVRTILPERRNEVSRQIGNVIAEHAARGVLHSSMTVLRINEILGRELEARSILIWQAIVRIHKIVGLDSDVDLPAYFKDLFKKYHNESLNELILIFEKETKKFKFSIPCELQKVSALSIDKHEIEIDLYSDSISENPVAGDAGQNSIYNFYGAVGVIQSGAGAQANLVQNLGEPERQELLNALAEVREAILSAANVGEEQTKELAELVDDSVAELRKTHPNNSRLRAFFDVLSGTVQSIASAGPAYQALKNALIPLGVLLP